jgi:hypothetical protein
MASEKSEVGNCQKRYSPIFGFTVSLFYNRPLVPRFGKMIEAFEIKISDDPKMTTIRVPVRWTKDEEGPADQRYIAAVDEFSVVSVGGTIRETENRLEMLIRQNIAKMKAGRVFGKWIEKAVKLQNEGSEAKGRGN